MPRQDKQQKDRDERDDDERDEDEREEEEEESDEASEDEDESDEDEAGDDDDADEAKAKKAEESDDDDDEPDEAASRVAKALGVGVEDDEAKAEAEGEGASEDKPEEEEAAKPNRAARRREEALARRKKRAASEADGASGDVGLSKDKNARAKELLKRRKEQAATAARAPVANSLDAGEMVDDALARTGAAISKWFRNNVQAIQWVILVVLVGAGGYVLYNSRVEKKAGDASTKLLSGIAADRGVVTEEDKRSQDEKDMDTRRVYKTTSERADAALGAFNSVVEQHQGSGAALLAKLGQGGAYLEKKEYDKAIAAYAEVLSSPLAAADPDVKGRAIEGTGFAKEAKGELDAAITSFKELGSIDVKGYKELATYHEARVTFAKGDKAKAKDLLEPLNTKLTTPSTEPQPLGYLKSAVSDLLTQIDPSAASAAANKPPGGKMPSAEELQDMARRALEQKAPPKP